MAITREEVDFRVAQVAEKISRGTPRKEIVQWIVRDTDWEIKEAQAYNYIQKAWDMIREIGAVNVQQQFGKALFDLQHLYKEALANKDLDLALKVRKELSDTLGLKKQTIRFEAGDNEKEQEMDVVQALIANLTTKRRIQEEELKRGGRKSIEHQETGA